MRICALLVKKNWNTLQIKIVNPASDSFFFLKNKHTRFSFRPIQQDFSKLLKELFGLIIFSPCFRTVLVVLMSKGAGVLLHHMLYLRYPGLIRTSLHPMN